MKKINNKGFMLAEIIIVSAIIMLTIVGVYKGFSSTHEIYVIRNSYYDSNILYSLKNFENFLIDSMILNDIKSNNSFTFQEIKKDTFKSDNYRSKSVKNFFDTYAISKLYLVKYDATNIENFTNDTNTEVDSDIRKFVKFYIKNLPDEEQYDKYDYVLIARTGTIKTSDNENRQVAEKYGALRIGTGNSKAPDNPCSKNVPISISYNDDYELLHNNRILKIKKNTNLEIINISECKSTEIGVALISGGDGGKKGGAYYGGDGGNGGKILQSNIMIEKNIYSINIGKGGLAEKNGEETNIKYNDNIILTSNSGIKKENTCKNNCFFEIVFDDINCGKYGIPGKNGPVGTAYAGPYGKKQEDGANAENNTGNGGDGGQAEGQAHWRNWSGQQKSQIYDAGEGGNGGSGVILLYNKSGWKTLP